MTSSVKTTPRRWWARSAQARKRAAIKPRDSLAPERSCRLNERLGDYALVEKGRNESIGKDHLSAKPVIQQLGSLATQSYWERLSEYY